METLVIEGGAMTEAIRVSRELKSRGIVDYSVLGRIPALGGGIEVSANMDKAALTKLLEEMGCKIAKVQDPTGGGLF